MPMPASTPTRIKHTVSTPAGEKAGSAVSSWASLPPNAIDAPTWVREGLAETFFFDPSPSVRRVITIGTPHRGSEFANDTTRWLGRKLIRIPSMIMQGRHQLIARNPGYFRPNAPLDIRTSIDSLAPESPLLPVLLAAERGPWVRYHNVVGEAPSSSFASWLDDGEGDGVVSLASAQLDDVESQIVVPADHSRVHRHPQCILEVRRILIQHLAELRTFPYGGGVQQAAAAEGSITGAPAEQDAPVEMARGPSPILAR